MKRNVCQLGSCMVLVGLALTGLTGCQVSVGGQTLPSAYYLHDDVQYFAEGPEFKLEKEAAAMKAYNAELQSRGQTSPAAPAAPMP